LITNTTFFFPSWNIGSIIPLVSITYLALIHNYNTIKYICFISPRQRAGMHLVILRKYKACDFSYFIHYYYLLSYILRCNVIVWFFIIWFLIFYFAQLSCFELKFVGRVELKNRRLKWNTCVTYLESSFSSSFY